MYRSMQWDRQRVCVSQHATGQAGELDGLYPSMQLIQGRCEAGGTHPTGMHPCSFDFFCLSLSLSLFIGVNGPLRYCVQKLSLTNAFGYDA